MDFLSQVLHNDPEVQAELASRNALDGLPEAAESGIDAATIEHVLLGEAAEGARGSEVRPLVATGMAAHQMRAEAVVLWEGRPSLLALPRF